MAKQHLVIMETCLKQKTFTVPRMLWRKH